jgi:hypothetical protein
MKTLRAVAAVIVVLVLAVASYEGIARPFIQNWGTQGDESTRALPGDDIVQPAAWQATRAIGIAAPASTVWAWVAQLGQDRGGFYSFKRLENLFGSEMPDVRTLDPTLQHWAVGDPLRMLPAGTASGAMAATLKEMEVGRYLAFEGHAAFGSGSWTLVVVPEGPDQTRLLVRDRTAAGMTRSQALMTRALMQPTHFVMEQRMLRGIKAIAEGRRISTAGNDVLTALWLFTGMVGIAAAVVALRRRRFWVGLAVLLGCALLFQVLTFMQPDPIVGTILLCALVMALVPFRGLTSAPSPPEPVTAGRVSPPRRMPSRGLLIACVASVVVYGLGDLVSGLLYRGYSYKDQWISELSAFGSPVRLLMVAAILIHGLLLFVVGVGIWRAADRRSLRWVGVLLLLAGVIGFPTHTVFAMSSRWMTAGFNDTMHAMLSLTFSLIVFAAVVLSAVAFSGWFRLYAIATIPVLVGFGAASSVAIQGMAQNSTPWAGAFERINAYAYFAWLIVLAVIMTRRSVQRGRRHADMETEDQRSDWVGHVAQARSTRVYA